jgi:hypothetical protein
MIMKKKNYQGNRGLVQNRIISLRVVENFQGE